MPPVLAKIKASRDGIGKGAQSHGDKDIGLCFRRNIKHVDASLACDCEQFLPEDRL